MANIYAPFGLKQMTSAMGAPSNFELKPANIAYNDSTAIYFGDPVKKLASGFISAWTPGTAVSQLAGIFAGVDYLSISQGKIVSSPYWPGADVASQGQNTIVAKIVPINLALPAEFVIQSDATGCAFADIGLNVDVAMGTGNVANGLSGAYLDMSTKAVTATLPFRIEALWGGPLGAGGRGGVQPGTNGPYSGSATGAYNWVVVSSNNSGAGSTGI